MSWQGWVVDGGHYPDRKKPVLVFYLDGEYQGHAVFKDEASYEVYRRFLSETRWPGGGDRMSDTCEPRGVEDKLRALNKFNYECSTFYREERDRLKAENAKLRELVRDMWREGAFEAGACYVCEAERLEERTRELGIEVDE